MDRAITKTERAAKSAEPTRTRPTPRRPLVERKRATRAAARRRLADGTREPLTKEQRGFDPLVRQRPGAGARSGRAAGALLTSAALHFLIVGIGLVLGGDEAGRRDEIQQSVTVQIREKPPEPPPPPPEPEPVVEDKAPEPPKPTPIERPKVAKPTPPPPAAPPPPEADPPKTPPPRVVGLTLESTVAGGDGPSFAVGNTLQGKTDTRATDATKVVPGGTGPADAPAVAPTGPVNQVASRVPTAGVTYTQPKRRAPIEPPYPETLKAQGIEADVTVMVKIDASGRVTDVKVIRPAAYPEFNEAAQATALKEEFEPATKDGVPIPYSVSYTYRFRLEDN